eukprot:TRINITY_DN6899_c1_g1_i1.p1 TRINITY_DN6899_c1_g1~~TRINITY_DN6899_c1_g1_i1.p1  ORF type:complete len:201 (-),score=65.48 TRINITY_DN6899_c1_g1_i1:358-873(-)
MDFGAGDLMIADTVLSGHDRSPTVQQLKNEMELVMKDIRQFWGQILVHMIEKEKLKGKEISSRMEEAMAVQKKQVETDTEVVKAAIVEAMEKEFESVMSMHWDKAQEEKAGLWNAMREETQNVLRAFRAAMDRELVALFAQVDWERESKLAGEVATMGARLGDVLSGIEEW